MTTRGRRFGPYRALFTMGEGGMGIVYAAQDSRDGTNVALKTLPVPRAFMLGGIRREIRALARIDHPGIVRILDEGVEEGVPWFAMELVLGKPLDQAAAALPPDLDVGRPPGVAGGIAGAGSLVGRLTLVRRLCAALAHLHGEGLIHRDLKPGNVIVRPEGMPVIIDFGLISRFAAGSGRESMEEVGRAAGTAAYMAPEQVRGDLVDPRADLYSVGCILYELIVGNPPFGKEKDTDVLVRQLAETAKPPSTVIAGVPPKLDALVMKLLEKDPRHRMGHADDVAAALASLGAGSGMTNVGARPRPYLYRPALHGRDEAMGAIAKAAATVLAGDSEVVLVSADSGLGRTRLLLALAIQLRDQSVDVVACACERATGEERSGLLFSILEPLVDRCRHQGEEATARIFGDRATVLAELAPSIASLPGMAGRHAPEPLDAEAARTRTFGYLMETLAAAGQDAPLSLLLDDLQWADELALDFLAYFARARKHHRCRVLIVGAFRTDGAHEAAASLGALAASGGTTSVVLDALPASDVREMVADMLGVAEPPRGLLAFLRRAGGNPFFVSEYVRLAVERGILEREAAGGWSHAGGEADDATPYEVLPVPSSVQEALGPRLDALGAAARSLLETASVVGLGSEARLMEIAALSTAAFDDASLELLERRILKEDAEGRLRFSKEALRLLAYERMDAAARREAHRKAAAALLADPERLAELAWHLERSGEVKRAAPVYLAAARRAAKGFLLSEAARLYRSFLSSGGGPQAASIAARRELAEDVLRRLGDNAGAQAVLEEALLEARRVGAAAFEAAILLGLARGERIAGRLGEASARLEEALAVFRAESDRRGEGQVLLEMGAVAYDRGRLDDARDMLEAALAVARQAEVPEDEAVALQRLASVHGDQGRIAEARQLHGKALEIDRRLRRRVDEAANLEALATLSQREGSWEEARDLHEAAIAIARAVGERRLEGLSILRLGAIHEGQGRLEEADALYRAAYQNGVETGARRVEGDALGSLAALRGLLGKRKECVTWLREALELDRETGNKGGMGVALYSLGLAYQHGGKPKRAREAYERALEVLGQVGDLATTALVVLRQAEMQLAEGRPHEALELLARAIHMGSDAPSPAAVAHASIVRGRIRRLLGDQRGALAALGETKPVTRRLRHAALSILLRCEQAHVALATGNDPATFLREAKRSLDQMKAGKESELTRAFMKAERTAEAARAGEELFRGELAAELIGIRPSLG